MKQSIKIRAATCGDFQEIVLVHQAAFPGFFLTQLGPAFLRAYYELIFQFHGGILLVAECDGKVAGFVAGFLNPAQFYRELSRRKLRFALPLLLSVLKRPGNLVRILERVRRVKQVEPPSGADCELSSIGVSPQFTGMGIGKQLVRAFLEEAFSRGATGVYLTTDAVNNEAVNAFYQKLGFRLTKTFTTAEGRQMNEYIFHLREGES